MKTFKDILNEASKKDVWGQRLPGTVEDYSAVKVGDLYIELFYDNDQNVNPWTAFVMGFGPVAHANSKQDALKEGKKRVKSFSKSDLAKIAKAMTSYKKAGII
jgi:hypothetical protein